VDMKFEVHSYQAGRWADPETPSELRRGSAAFKQAGRRHGEDARDVSFWKSTLQLLEAEVLQLELDGLVIIEIGAADWDMRTDRTGPLAKAPVSHPGAVISFESRLHGPLRWATDAYEAKYWGDPPGWQANVRAVALTLSALRAIDRWGVAKSGQQYTGWKALPAGGGLTFPSADAAVRWMRENQPKGFIGDTARELYRALARRWHEEGSDPDPEKWERLQAARLLLQTANLI
jgi:hypothetical protein